MGPDAWSLQQDGEEWQQLESLCSGPVTSLASDGACLEDREYLGVRAGQLPLSVPTGPTGKSGNPMAKPPLLRRVSSF